MSESKYQPLRSHARGDRTGLCLSGGGYRATLFHLGSLRRLNEIGLLSKIDTFSSVSGGSITNGLLALVWPRLTPDANGVFTNFDNEVLRPLRRLCGTDIRTAPLVWQRLDPRKWWRLSLGGDSAANLLGDAYADHLVGQTTLQHLTNVAEAGGPDFIFCATNYQTGVNFVFTPRVIGDWTIGYTEGRSIRLADAIACSSAFPIGFPLFTLRPGVPPAQFKRGALRHDPDYPRYVRRILLTDGGVYDNLGLEPVWKNHATVFCSDGGAPFLPRPRPRALLPFRLMRANDIINNQARAVRKRWLIASYEKCVYNGCYWGVGTDIDDYEVGVEGYRGEELARVAGIRTDLNRFSDDEQHMLITHGHALAHAAIERHFVSQLRVA
ncbi:MAG TPA: patatin-like phospholipase family protein [Pyrinomonadaceae bacterium]|jgi:NTE family protein